jgi:agmatine/peptidylarginine deiminase
MNQKAKYENKLLFCKYGVIKLNLRNHVNGAFAEIYASTLGSVNTIMSKWFATLCISALLMTMTQPVSAQSELIVLASPVGGDDYYADVEDNIFEFHVNFANQILPNDMVLILTDSTRAPDYVEALGEEHVLVMPMLDIWMRDFTTANPTDPIMFRYTAVAQDNQKMADEVQAGFYDFVAELGLSFEETDLLNDGGNFVDDGHGSLVVSTKFLKDNSLSEDEARKILTGYESINHVAFIEADEQGGLEHADGVVSFIDRNTLIINRYPEDHQYAKQLKKDLKRGIPGIRIHEIATPYDDSEIYDERFGSACGLYTNALVTAQRVYLPQFGIPEDKQVLERVRSLTSKDVIPVNSEQICFMGGGVRCMSWQVRGITAQRILASLKR